MSISWNRTGRSSKSYAMGTRALLFQSTDEKRGGQISTSVMTVKRRDGEGQNGRKRMSRRTHTAARSSPPQSDWRRISSVAKEAASVRH
mmetsp:Transcript_43252/g.85312  ORF Transcript_43252/g.85312 Transcript_43252/m.85312 type:complete len:89 (-) Transcript_43252:290-556(-)